MAKKNINTQLIFDFDEPRIKVFSDNGIEHVFDNTNEISWDRDVLKAKLSRLIKAKFRNLKFFSKPSVELLLPSGFSKENEDLLIDIFKDLGILNIVISSCIVNYAKELEIPIEEKEPTALINIKLDEAEIAILSSNKIVTSTLLEDFDIETESKNSLDKLIEKFRALLTGKLKNFDRGVIFIGEIKVIEENKEYVTKTLKLPVIII